MVVLLERIELSTSALPRMRSTTELQQPTIFSPVRNARWAFLAGGAARETAPMRKPRGFVKPDSVRLPDNLACQGKRLATLRF
jgi:hypothetical protein